MNSDSSIDNDVKKIEKIIKYQLPSKYKKIGFVLFLISMVVAISFDVFFKMNGYEVFYEQIAKNFAILGLLMMSISREKIEDELIVKLRMQSYVYTFIIVIMVSLGFSFVNCLIAILHSKTVINDTSNFTILGSLLSIQLYSFWMLKKSYNEK